MHLFVYIKGFGYIIKEHIFFKTNVNFKEANNEKIFHPIISDFNFHTTD